MEKLPKINIIYEDNHLLVVEKPINIPVCEDITNDIDLLTILKNYLKDYTLLDKQEKDGIVVWEEYLVYSVLFNQNKKMIEKYKSIVE